MSRLNNWFARFADQSTKVLGSPPAIMVAGLLIIVWALSGPLLVFSDTWQLIANTGTTLVNFIVGFLILNSGNRAARANQLQHDEIIRAGTARNEFINLTSLSDQDLDRLEEQMRQARQSRTPGAAKEE